MSEVVARRLNRYPLESVVKPATQNGKRLEVLALGIISTTTASQKISRFDKYGNRR
jgi:hypothetical protein